jgi:outer membrane protein assembly factor BamB
VKLSGITKTPEWTFKTGGAIWSSPQMSFNKVIFGSTDGKVYALDKNGGQLLWEFSTGSPIKGSPLIQNGSIYILAKNGFLYKLGLEKGTEVWNFNTQNDEVEENNSPYDDYSSGPVIDDGTVYIGSSDYNLYAIDEDSGKEIWRFSTEGMISSTALLDEANVYVGSLDNRLYSIDRKTGALIWKFDTNGPVISSPLSYKNLVIIGSRNSDLYALQKDTGSPEWIYSYWTSWVESSGIIVDDRLYIGSSDSGNVYCLDPATGDEYWTSFVGGSAWGNPAISDKNLYTGVVGTVGYSIDHKGAFVCLDASNGIEKWRFDYQPIPDQLTFGVYSTPLVSDGLVLFGGLDGVFYAFEE